MQRFKAALTNGYWPQNPEPLVRDDNGEYVKYSECTWTWDDNPDGYSCWETTCEESFCLIEGNPVDNLYNYCPSCGGKINEVTPHIQGEG